MRVHAGTVGNECADELVRNAALKKKTTADYDCFPLSFAKNAIRAASLEEWQKRYAEESTGKITNGFAQFLHRFKLANSPYCACASDRIQNLLHVLEECPIFLKERAETEVGTGVRILRENFLDLLSKDENSKMFIGFCEEVFYCDIDQTYGYESFEFVSFTHEEEEGRYLNVHFQIYSPGNILTDVYLPSVSILPHVFIVRKFRPPRNLSVRTSSRASLLDTTPYVSPYVSTTKGEKRDLQRPLMLNVALRTLQARYKYFLDPLRRFDGVRPRPRPSEDVTVPVNKSRLTRSPLTRRRQRYVQIKLVHSPKAVAASCIIIHLFMQNSVRSGRKAAAPTAANAIMIIGLSGRREILLFICPSLDPLEFSASFLGINFRDSKGFGGYCRRSRNREAHEYIKERSPPAPRAPPVYTRSLGLHCGQL
ncbi:hypothetical protein EVAR_14101_1 [Eumeta japonica]|uniref:Uncharacterized protein n=1 Tax=Eumeta variegata TaxID=151549 RepID=A0A4C1UNX6_EUMVA|nr:hypothetical protein EVAR_14101_1 [Eumeta japonica]